MFRHAYSCLSYVGYQRTVCPSLNTITSHVSQPDLLYYYYISIIGSLLSQQNTCRHLINDGEDLVQNLLSDLTGGLFDVSTNGVSFEAGPLSEVGGILDRFNLNFDFLTQYKEDFDSFTGNLANQSLPEIADLIDLKPPSLSRFGNLLQIGSKHPSPQFSLVLKQKLWDKLTVTFPSHLYNGVAVPGLPLGKSFLDVFPNRDDLADFDTRDFLQAIAVAYGKAPSFSDARAVSFTMTDLFTPEFGEGLSARILEKLKAEDSLSDLFSGFDSTDEISGLPMNSMTKKLFDINAYIPEIQVALKLAPSLDLTASGFSAADLQEALFPFPVPSIRSFASFVKREIIPQIKAVMDFGVGIDTSKAPFGGLSIDTPSLDGSGFNFGTFSNKSTQLFPPSVNLDSVQVR